MRFDQRGKGKGKEEERKGRAVLPMVVFFGTETRESSLSKVWMQLRLVARFSYMIFTSKGGKDGRWRMKFWEQR